MHQAEQINQRVDQAVGQQVADLVDIVDDAHQDLAVRPVVKVGEGQALQMAEHAQPDIMDDALADLVHVAHPESGHQGDRHDDRRIAAADHQHQPGQVLVRDHLVDRLHQDQRRQQVQGAGQDHDRQGAAAAG